MAYTIFNYVKYFDGVFFLPALPSFFMTTVQMSYFFTICTYSDSLCNIMHCASSALLLYFPFISILFLFISVPFCHEHPASTRNPSLSSIFQSLRLSMRRQKSSRASNEVFRCCRCLISTVLRPKLALASFVNPLITGTALHNAPRITTCCFATKATTTFPFAKRRLWMI